MTATKTTNKSIFKPLSQIKDNSKAKARIEGNSNYRDQNPTIASATVINQKNPYLFIEEKYLATAQWKRNDDTDYQLGYGKWGNHTFNDGSNANGIIFDTKLILMLVDTSGLIIEYNQNAVDDGIALKAGQFAEEQLPNGMKLPMLYKDSEGNYYQDHVDYYNKLNENPNRKLARLRTIYSVFLLDKDGIPLHNKPIYIPTHGGSAINFAEAINIAKTLLQERNNLDILPNNNALVGYAIYLPIIEKLAGDKKKSPVLAFDTSNIELYGFDDDDETAKLYETKAIEYRKSNPKGCAFTYQREDLYMRSIGANSNNNDTLLLEPSVVNNNTLPPSA